MKVNKVTDVGKAFYNNMDAHNGRNIQTMIIGNERLLVGYGWAIYAAMDLTSKKITYYSGWYGYSNTTSKHLNQTNVSWKHDIKSNEARRM